MIKLSKLTDYAVIILAEMAKGGVNGQALTATSLAARTQLPEPTVAKVLKLLVKGGIITSTRGAMGGYSLPKPPEEISVADVISAMNGPVTLTACVSGSDECCAHEKKCPMKGTWDPVNDALRGALSNVTLAQMMTGMVIL